MLWMLFGMNLWWFQYMVWLLVRIVTGISHGVEDTREIPKSTTANGKLVENGDVSVGNDIHGKVIKNMCSVLQENIFQHQQFVNSLEELSESVQVPLSVMMLVVKLC